MTIYFLDSSAIAKRYIPEIGTPWIRQITDPASQNDLFIARITWVEVLSALARRQREGSVSRNDVHRAIDIFAIHVDQQYGFVETDRPLTEAAGDLVRQYPLRAYDAIQLAAALAYYHDNFDRIRQDLAESAETVEKLRQTNPSKLQAKLHKTA